jgi:hypothetical protein
MFIVQEASFCRRRTRLASAKNIPRASARDNGLLSNISLADIFSFARQERNGRLAFSGPGDSGGA